jgi:hypothetical protein
MTSGNKIYRIRQYKSAGILLPDRISEFDKTNRYLTDNDKNYQRKIASLTKRAYLLNKEYLRFAFVGEEWNDGQWEIIFQHPEGFLDRNHKI